MQNNAAIEVEEEIFSKLGDSYRRELPSRLESLERLVPMAAGGSRAALEEIIMEAHKLRGTAKFFQLPKIYDAMTDVEDLLTTLSPVQDHFRDSSAWLRVDKALLMARCAITEKEHD